MECGRDKKEKAERIEHNDGYGEVRITTRV